MFSDQMFLRVMQNITELVFIMKVENNSTFRYMFLNEPAKKHAGLTDDAFGHTLQEVLQPELAAKIQKEYEDAVQAKTTTTFEDVVDGTIVNRASTNYSKNLHYFESKITPIFQEDGTCSYLIAVVRDITERKRKVIELQALKNRFESIFNYSFDGIYSLDLNGVITSCNEASLLISGYSENELMGHHVSEFIETAALEAGKAHFHQAKIGFPQQYQSVLHHKNGHSVHIHVMQIPIYDEENIVGVFGIIHDLTDQMRAEDEIRESEKRYRRLVELSPEGIIVHENNRILFANLSAQSILQDYNLEGKDILSFVCEEDRTEAKSRVLRLQSGHELPFSEIRFLRADGMFALTEVGGTSISFDGKPAIMTMVRDMTERKKVEQTLQETEQKYRLIAEHMSDLVLMLTPEGYITYASPSHISELGNEPSSYIGKHVTELVHPDEVGEVIEKFEDLITYYRIATAEIRHMNADGEWVWLEVKASPISGKDGHLENVLIVSRDITDRQLLRQRLEYMAFHDSLTGLANRRLLKEKMAQAMKEADRYDRHLVIFYLDLDKFKEMNDTFGHDVGDELLVVFTNRMKQRLREVDVMARLGGDEFCILLEVNDPQDVHAIAKSLLEEVEEPFHIFDHEFAISTSIGVALYESGLSIDEWIKRADTALYAAKDAGRNTYKIW